MATIREKRPGVWEVRAFLGRDHNGKPVQTSRTVRGTKRDAQFLAAELTTRPDTSSVRRITVSEMLDFWVESQRSGWAPGTESNQLSRITQIRTDRIASIQLSRLTAVDVDRWHARLAKQGRGEGSIRGQHAVLRAAVTLAVRWGWINFNVVAVAQLGKRKSQPRGTLTNDQVRDVLAAAQSLVGSGKVEPAAALALRIAAVTGARRAELAALRWTDLQDGRLTIDSSIAII